MLLAEKATYSLQSKFLRDKQKFLQVAAAIPSHSRMGRKKVSSLAGAVASPAHPSRRGHPATPPVRAAGGVGRTEIDAPSGRTHDGFAPQAPHRLGATAAKADPVGRLAVSQAPGTLGYPVHRLAVWT